MDLAYPVRIRTYLLIISRHAPSLVANWFTPSAKLSGNSMGGKIAAPVNRVRVFNDTLRGSKEKSA